MILNLLAQRIIPGGEIVMPGRPTVVVPVVAIRSWVPDQGESVLITVGTDRGDVEFTFGRDEEIEAVTSW